MKSADGISTSIDVDGTTNLDAVDIDGVTQLDCCSNSWCRRYWTRC